MPNPDPVDELIAVVRQLAPAQVQLLLNMAQAMSSGLTSTINPASDLLDAAAAATFANILLMHHANHREKFNKKGFEYAFVTATLASGKTAKLVTSTTNPGADVLVDGMAFSLKTEAAKSIRRDYIFISKLMEARWIRECQTPEAFLQGVMQAVIPHLRQYQRILILRAFDLASAQVQYDLVEIPRDLLLAVTGLQSADFKLHTGRSGGSRADVLIAGRKAFTLNLEGSVEKVQIRGLDVARCILHGSWVVLTGT